MQRGLKTGSNWLTAAVLRFVWGVVLVFGVASLASAAELRQATDDTTLPAGSWTTIQEFSNFPGIFSQAVFKYDTGEANDLEVLNATIFDISGGYSGADMVSQSTAYSTSTDGFVTFDLTTYQYDQNNSYAIVLGTGDSSRLVYWRGVATSTYQYGAATNSNGSSTAGCTFYTGVAWVCSETDLADLYFITNSSPYYPSFDTGSSTIDQLTTTCDPDSGFFETSLCKLALALFIPSEAAFDQFSDLKDDLENKPPFGYISSAIDAANFSSSSTSTIDLTFMTGIGIFDDFKTAANWFVWITFLFFIIYRFRHFKF